MDDWIKMLENLINKRLYEVALLNFSLYNETLCEKARKNGERILRDLGYTDQEIKEILNTIITGGIDE